MPTPQLRALASKAGATVGKAEKCWANVKKSARERGKGVKDFYGYVVGGTKKCLGLEARDLVRAGIPADLVASGVRMVAGEELVETPVLGKVSRGLAAATIGHLYFVEHGGRSRIAERSMSGAHITDQGRKLIMAGLNRALTEASGVDATQWEYWRSLFPNIQEFYVALMLPFLPDNPYYSKDKAPDPYHYNPYPFDARERNAIGESRRRLVRKPITEAAKPKHAVISPEATVDELLAALAELGVIFVIDTPAGKVLSDKELSKEDAEKLTGGEEEEVEKEEKGEEDKSDQSGENEPVEDEAGLEIPLESKDTPKAEVKTETNAAPAVEVKAEVKAEEKKVEPSSPFNAGDQTKMLESMISGRAAK